MTKVHSKIGASSMERWSSCPGSVRLCRDLESKSSEYAAEGSAAHELAEMCLLENCAADSHLGEKIEHDGFTFEVTEEMAEAVQVYLDAVRAAVKEDDDGTLFVERSFDLSAIYPGLFGTSDAIVWLPRTKTLRVFDLKYGAGIAVDVIGNPQLRYYALGAVVSLNLPVHTVEPCIVQPRCPHADGPVRKETLDITDLMDFRFDLIEYAKATEDPNAPLNPGDHCRFCPAAGLPCPALHAKSQEVAANEFRPDLSYDPDKLADALRWVPILKAFCKSVDEFAYAEAEAGRCPPGHKLVAKRANRKWRDPDEAARALVALGLGEPELYGEPELRSPAQIEEDLQKKLGLKPKQRAEALKDLVVKESSGHALVHESDKRPAVKPDAATEFSAVEQ